MEGGTVKVELIEGSRDYLVTFYGTGRCHTVSYRQHYLFWLAITLAGSQL